MTHSDVSNTFTYDQLAEFLGVETPENHAEEVRKDLLQQDYGWIRHEVRAQLLRTHEGKIITDEDIEKKSKEREERLILEERDRDDRRYRAAIVSVMTKLCVFHELHLIPVKKDGKETQFIIRPKNRGGVGWYRAAKRIIETINRYGREQFRSPAQLVESRSYTTVRKAVLDHLHWIPRYYEVYYGVKASDIVESAP